MKIRAAALLLAVGSLWAQTTPSPGAQTISSHVFVGGQSMQYLTELTDKFGPRLTGTPNYDEAAKWAADQFRAMGIPDVRFEPVKLLHTWKRGPAHGEILTPERRPLHIQPLGWSPSTPAGGVRGQIYVLDDISAASIKRQAGEIRGKIILLDLSKLMAAAEKSYRPWEDFLHVTGRVKQEGGLAVLRMSNHTSQVQTTTAPNWNSSIAPLPDAFIGKEDGEYIMRISKETPVQVEFQYELQVGGPKTVNSVVAEIPGREQPNDWILLGAHLDSWDFATGAQDNGAGTAEVLEAARVLSSLGKAPKRSIRFALWAGEEEGLLGSRSYVKQHTTELANCVAVLNTDNGANTVYGWKVEGRADVKKALQPFSDEVLKPFGADEISEEITYDTDHGPFMLAGIPVFDMYVDMKPYMVIHHTAGDTLDKVKPLDLNIGSAVLALTADYIANADQPIAPHLTRNDEGKLLKNKDLDQFLHSIGEW